ncbi:MAG: cation:proton antiporter subunit C [Gammaproteobacteria bacterium]
MTLFADLFAHYNYWVVIALTMLGMYVIMANPNLVKKIIGLNIFQTAVFILYISVAELEGGTAPILSDAFTVYANPLPHVLILTAIVVGVATTALALALAVRIYRAYQTIEEDDIDAKDAREEALR